MTLINYVNLIQSKLTFHRFSTKLIILVAFIGLFFSSVENSFAKRTVKGVITDKNGNPAVGVRVKAFDDDAWPNPDDLMGQDITDSNGYYEINYEGKHWDSAPHWWTVWRPDIFIRVSAPVNGWCENGKWKSGKNWIHLRDSGVKNNHKMSNDLTRNLQVPNFPLETPMVETFRRGINMYSIVDFFFHVTCFACASNGDKVTWGEWGFGGPPLVRTRCWFPPNRDCTKEDHKKIEELGQHPYPAEVAQVSMLSGLSHVFSAGSEKDYIPIENEFPVTPAHTPCNLGVTFAYFLTKDRGYGIELDGRYTLTSEVIGKNPSNKDRLEYRTKKHYTFTLNLIHQFHRGKFAPYILAGAGIDALTDFEDQILTTKYGLPYTFKPFGRKTSVVINAGTGINYLFSPTFGARLDVRYLLKFDKPNDVNSLNIMAGIFVRF